MRFNSKGESRIEIKDILDYIKDRLNPELVYYHNIERMIEDLVAETAKDAAIVDPSFITNLEDVKDWNICGYRVEELYKLALILRDKRVEDVDLRDYNNCFFDGYRKAQEEIHKQLEESVNRIIKGVEGN